MPRFFRLTALLVAAATVALAAAACGSQNISIPKSDPTYKADLQAATIFHERCGGCHTLSYAGTDGSGSNPRTYLDISGPNFNVRCERPVARVLYAIENGGFGGAYMPANVVVGQQAREVAEFVSKFAGRQAPTEPDTTPCQDQTVGSLPSTLTGGVSLASSTQTSTTSSSVSSGQNNADASQSNPSPNNGN